MKSIFIRLIILVFGLFFASAPSFCQVPGSINYQAVARDGSGNTLINQLVSFRLSILQGSPSGAVVYAESHVYTSNQFGLVTLKIGGGTVLSGNFSAIDWGRDDYYLQTEMDPSGGTAYLLTGTSQFLSVPYALYSKTSGNALPAGTAGQTLRNDGTTWIPNSTIYNGGSKVGVGIATPDNSAMLEVNSANKGFLPPRMTHAEMSAITDPAEGLMVFCTDCGVNGTGVVVIFMNGAWNTIAYTCILPASPISGTQVPSPAQIVWNWNTVSGAAGYKWNTTNNYGTAIDMFTTTSKTETGLTCNTPYTRYAWAYSACGSSTPVTLMQTTTGTPPSAPTAGGHMPSANQIVWNWNTVSGATGYKWNTSNNYATATDMGSATSKTETGLTCNTGYTRYAWSYSACGNSAPVTLTQTTTLNPPIAPAAGTHVPSATQIVWNWNNVPGLQVINGIRQIVMERRQTWRPQQVKPKQDWPATRLIPGMHGLTASVGTRHLLLFHKPHPQILRQHQQPESMCHRQHRSSGTGILYPVLQAINGIRQMILQRQPTWALRQQKPKQDWPATRLTPGMPGLTASVGTRHLLLFLKPHH